MGAARDRREDPLEGAVMGMVSVSFGAFLVFTDLAVDSGAPLLLLSFVLRGVDLVLLFAACLAAGVAAVLPPAGLALNAMPIVTLFLVLLPDVIDTVVEPLEVGLLADPAESGLATRVGELGSSARTVSSLTGEGNRDTLGDARVKEDRRDDDGLMDPDDDRDRSENGDANVGSSSRLVVNDFRREAVAGGSEGASTKTLMAEAGLDFLDVT